MRTKTTITALLVLIAFLSSGAALAQAGEGGLFWYTDLAAAKAAAGAAGKPILSLRLLGRLDEGASDADGRFFRTVLYQNREIHQILRNRYILHWSSVRQVPRPAIGSSAGSSIHYILDSRGRLLEPLPGLYGPAAFQAALEEGVRAQTSTAAHLDDEQFASWTVGRRRDELDLAAVALERDLKAAYPETGTNPAGHLHVKAFQAAPGTLAGWLHPGDLGAGEDELSLALNESQLHRLAELRRPRIHLDPASRASLLRERGITDPYQAERLVDAVESALAFAEVIHQYRVGPAILKALNDPQRREGFELEAFNDWVYKNIFSAPLADLPALTRKVEGNGC